MEGIINGVNGVSERINKETKKRKNKRIVLSINRDKQLSLNAKFINTMQFTGLYYYYYSYYVDIYYILVEIRAVSNVTILMLIPYKYLA